MFIPFTTLRSSWSRDNLWKTQLWRTKTGTNFCPSSNKSNSKRRRNPRSRRRSIIPSHLSNSQEYRISRWKLVSISSVRKKSMTEPWNSNARSRRRKNSRNKTRSKKKKSMSRPNYRTRKMRRRKGRNLCRRQPSLLSKNCRTSSWPNL